VAALSDRVHFPVRKSAGVRLDMMVFCSQNRRSVLWCRSRPGGQDLVAARTGFRSVLYLLAVKAMLCKSCGPENLHKFEGEIAIHFPGMKNIDKPIVWVRPELAVCLDCASRSLLFRKPNCEC